MRQAKKLICILLGALMLVSALSGCAQTAEDGSERFIVPVAVRGTVTSLDPAMNTEPGLENVFYALYENLLRMETDEEGRAALTSGIAREYELVENFDGTVDYVFTLRSSARWSDGTRVKAKDFVYAWRRLANPATDSPNGGMLSMVRGYDAVRETGDATQLGVRADGDSTFRVTLEAPCPYFLSDICTAVPTMPLRSDAANKNPDWASSSAVLCNGPYRIGVWDKEDYLQLRRNDSYYESRMVTPDTLRFLFSVDEAEAWRHYETGEADYVTGVPRGAEGAEALPLRRTAYVLYNHMSEAFSRAHVRRAFDLVLDRAAVAAAAGPEMTPATGLVPFGVAGASAEQDFRALGGVLCAADEEGYPQRCIEAEGELRLGGYWGGTGFPEATCLYVAEDGMRLTAMAAVGFWQEKLNVPVMAEGLTREEFDERVAAGAYDLAIDTITADYGDAMDYLAPFAGTDGSNALHYVSTPYDLLIGVAASSRDSAARAAFLHDAEALLLDETALSPLYFGGTTSLLRGGLTGVRHDLRGNAYFTAVTRVEAEE